MHVMTFAVPVYFKNACKYSLIAEKNFGKLGEKVGNTLYIQLGMGSGSALYLDQRKQCHSRRQCGNLFVQQCDS